MFTGGKKAGGACNGGCCAAGQTCVGDSFTYGDGGDYGCCSDGVVLCGGVCCRAGSACDFNGQCTKPCESFGTDT
jgi:hypothetical protein